MTCTRRVALGALTALPVSASSALAAQDKSAEHPFAAALDALSRARNFAHLRLTYRGVHFGTHPAVFYESTARIEMRQGARVEWHATADELHDEDVLTGPNRVPQVKHEHSVDAASGEVLLEAMHVLDKPVRWRYQFDRPDGRLKGERVLGGPALAVHGAALPGATTGGALDLAIASWPLASGYKRQLQIADFDGRGAAIYTPAQATVTRKQFVRLGAQAVEVYRIEITSDKPFTPATGVRLALTTSPHWVVRAEYQSTHMDGPPVFDSRGVDVLTAVDELRTS